MDQFVDQFSSSSQNSFSPSQYIIYIVLCTTLLFILALVYERFGQSISNRAQLSKVLMIVGLTTFIIISIVKSSLALSLGLVGALSIVRFRTAIKEPEELGYFFMAIAIGLGMGANHLLPTVIGFSILMLVVILQNGFKNTSITQNLLINLNCDSSKSSDLIQQITDTIQKNTRQLDLKRVKHGDNSLAINYLVKLKSFNELNRINEELTALDPSIEITFIDNTL